MKRALIASLAFCPACKGSGRKGSEPCAQCGGIGVLVIEGEPTDYVRSEPRCTLDHPAGEHCEEPLGAPE